MCGMSMADMPRSRAQRSGFVMWVVLVLDRRPITTCPSSRICA